MRATVGISLGVLGVLGVLCAVVGILVTGGISIEILGIILGGFGYYVGLQGGNRAGQILRIVSVVLNVISIVVSGVSGGPQ